MLFDKSNSRNISDRRLENSGGIKEKRNVFLLLDSVK